MYFRKDQNQKECYYYNFRKCAVQQLKRKIYIALSGEYSMAEFTPHVQVLYKLG